MKLFTLLFLSVASVFVSCSKDEEEKNENQEPSQFYTYDNANYDISNGAAEISIATGIGGNPDIIGSMTLVFIDGTFFEDDIEYITTSTTQGLYLGIDLYDLDAKTISELNLDGNTFSLDDAGIFTEIIGWDEKFTSNNVEYGFPDEVEGFDIDYDGASSITFNEISIDEVNNSMTIDISYLIELENGKNAFGDYKGIISLNIN